MAPARSRRGPSLVVPPNPGASGLGCWSGFLFTAADVALAERVLGHQGAATSITEEWSIVVRLALRSASILVIHFWSSLGGEGYSGECSGELDLLSLEARHEKRPLLRERPSTIQRRYGLPAGRSRSRLVAVRAVNRLVTTGLERYHCFLAALRAGRGVHLALRSIVAAATTTATTVGAATTVAATLAGASFGAAGGTTLRILVAAASVELLVLHTEDEPVTALGTGQGSFCIGHVFHLF